MALTFIVVLLLKFVGESLSSPVVYCVDREAGSNYSSDCLTLDSANGCCGSLSLLLSKLYENTSRPTQITIEIRLNLFLNETVSFENFDRIEIIGINEPSVFCSRNDHDEMNAGLYFKDSANILMTNMTFVSCGSLRNDSLSEDFNNHCFHSSLYFFNCSNLTLERIVVKDGEGTGAVLYNVFGTVSISHSLFDNNRVRNPRCSGGGGMLIVLTNSPSGKFGEYSTSLDDCKSNCYTIQNCNFSNNCASSLERIYIHSDDVLRQYGRGGGLAVYLDGNMTQSSVKITKSCFQNNSATLGGGLFVMFRGDSSFNSITVEDSDFIANNATASGPQKGHSNIERNETQRLIETKGPGGGGGGAGGGFLFNKNKNLVEYSSLVFVN